MPPQKILKSRGLEMPFPAFSKRYFPLKTATKIRLFLDAILFDRGKPLDQTCNVLPRTLCAPFSKMASVNSTKSVGKIITPKTERSEMFQPQNLLYYLLKLEVINVSSSLTELWGVCIKFEEKSDSKTFNRSCGVGGGKEQSTRRSIAGSRLLLKPLTCNYASIRAVYTCKLQPHV